ncbi:hypothetical protein [Asanoa iriomotensis]|uniref:hypothetical protein n=1 Tax=Asanoa iriomotensis TaxID=234613 RepID=UPI001EF208EA|nr:hypothetical protein [Asanoa iriomotensis]
MTRERARVATEGWGARLLTEQSPDGNWGGGVYTPKWTSTTYTLLHLLWLGLPAGHPAALRGCGRLWEWADRRRVSETCIVSMFARVSCAFGFRTPRVTEAIDFLLAEQQHDGGWNCASRGDRTKHSSFHTSVMALEALAAADQADALASQRGREFFLNHRLFRAHRTGEIAIRASTRFPAFPEWHFDVLRGLELFAATATPGDERLTDAIDLIQAARRADGRWPRYQQYPGPQWFALEPPGPSRWTTTRALHILTWWANG